MGKGPVAHGAVDVVRRVYVVGRQLLLELLDKGFVLFRALLFDFAPKRKALRRVAAELQPSRIEAGDRDVKTGGGQRPHFPAQNALVCRRLCEQVVGMDERAPLQLAEAVDLDTRELRVAALTCRQDPPVSVDQVALGVNAGRHDPAELIEAVDQTVDLLLRVQLRVALVRDQLVDLSPDELDAFAFHAILRHAVAPGRYASAFTSAARALRASHLKILFSDFLIFH